ncbi:PadR family transcriptional regulator [Klebsiella pneumoniae]|nr:MULTISPECIES: helix-turn-helix transcriptional regulator [Enterobacteriaceae]MDQ5295107.1 helix-turn-helix transcriptional regulator [Klebsiella pneumoniae]MDQ5305904.1 helix-turn-helix transcriptional regulator [Klebsiella pneumoniae]MDQ5338601.1 helix-turn-helix transcriptional regulator [Klebsiella pneumoniae]MDQ5343704.1 helix-turn-helix transcriptional regulator [Klebsiella pneumoniae]MDQ5392263.1 helix-turn-helix transcriptional regulator [Klebsiella pneumoniae]
MPAFEWVHVQLHQQKGMISLSPPTICNSAMLHGLEKKGYLTSRHERTGRRERRVYDITEQGRTALADAKTKVKELFGELVEGG